MAVITQQELVAKCREIKETLDKDVCDPNTNRVQIDKHLAAVQTMVSALRRRVMLSEG